MLRTLPPWISAQCTATPDMQTLALLDERDRPLYTLVGCKGVLTKNQTAIETAFLLRGAQECAKAALADPLLWPKAVELFETCSARVNTFPLPVQGLQVMQARNSELNVAALADASARIVAACKVAAMYASSSTLTIGELERMAKLSLESTPHNLLDHTSIVSQHAVMCCTDELDKANQVIATSVDADQEVASVYQLHVAQAELYYNIAHPSTLSKELKAKFQVAKNRVDTTYGTTYKSILRNATAAFTDVGT